jgi:hypothetical protein
MVNVQIYNGYHIRSPTAIHQRTKGSACSGVACMIWLGWAYLTKKMPHAATMPIVTAVVCFLSTQNMGS